MPVVEGQQVDRPRVTRLAAKLAGPAILLVMITGILELSAQGGEQRLTRSMEDLETMYQLTRRKGQADTYNTAWNVVIDF